MNLVARQIYGNTTSVIWNTSIGGVSASITSASSLATKLGISVGNISNFTIVGSDINCRITGNYDIIGSTFYVDTSITYYKDYDGLVQNIGISCFANTTNFTEGFFKNCLSVGANAFGGVVKQLIVYIPNCTTLGNTTGNEFVFGSVKAGSVIYCNPSLATNNGGAPDGDITYLISIYGVVKYVTSFVAPSPITTLVAGTIYSTAIQLTFTLPSSTNTIDYYECYANGVFKNIITASGQYLTGLNASTSYNITIIAVDIFYNKSVVSNSISQSTTSASWDIAKGLVSYYKLDETSGTIAADNFQGKRLTNTGITINQTGKIGTSYLSTVAAQKLETVTAIAVTGNFTMNAWIYRTASCPDYACVMEYQGYTNNRGFGIWVISNQISWIINQNYSHNIAATAIPLNTWVMVTFTYDGSNCKVYLDSVLKQTTANTVNPTISNIFRLFYNSNNNANFLGRVDESSTYNIALTQSNIDALYNSGNGITL